MRPSTEQLEQIERLSQVVYGGPWAAFERYSMPATRDAASQILHDLHNARRYGPDDTDMTDPIGEKSCLRCGQVKPLTAFNRDRNTSDGRHGWCKTCHRTAMRELRTRGDNMQERTCIDCGETKPLTSYPPAGRGRSKTCRTCHKGQKTYKQIGKGPDVNVVEIPVEVDFTSPTVSITSPEMDDQFRVLPPANFEVPADPRLSEITRLAEALNTDLTGAMATFDTFKKVFTP